jgi:hypothetical protein
LRHITDRQAAADGSLKSANRAVPDTPEMPEKLTKNLANIPFNASSDAFLPKEYAYYCDLINLYNNADTELV